MKTESAGKTERIGVFMAETVWSLLPPVITIILALATKEVYMSLAIGIFIGAFMFAGFSFLGAIDTMFAIMSDKIGSNVYILVFLVLLGIMVAAIQKSGASQAYGDYAARTIKGKRWPSISFLPRTQKSKYTLLIRIAHGNEDQTRI